MLNAANGNLSTAQDQVDYAVKAKFEPLKAQLAAQQAQLTAITPLLEREDKQRAVVQQAALTERARLLTKQEDDQKTILKTMTDAASVGADALTLRRIQNAATPEEAASLAAPFLAKPYQDQQKQQQFDNNIKTAQLAIQQAQLNLDRQKVANDAVTNADPAQILAYAQQYASNGNIPTGLPKGTFGIVSQVAKELPKPQGALVSSVTGIAPSSISPTQQAGITALSDIVTKTLPGLQRLFPKINTGIVGGTLGMLHTSQERQDYLTARQEFLNKLLVARSGATVTPQEYDRYAAMLPGTFNQPLFLGSDGSTKLNSISKNLNASLDTQLSTNQLAIYGYSKVDVGGQKYTVGEIVTNHETGQTGRINPDGSVTLIQ